MFICKECYIRSLREKTGVSNEEAKKQFDCWRKDYGSCEVCKKTSPCIEV